MITRRLWFALLGAVCLSAFARSTTATTIIDNTGTNGAEVHPFGAPDTATYGETFTVGSDNVLNSFSLFLVDRFSGSGTLDLRGYIGAWNGTGATSILYTSTTQTMNGAGTLQEFAFAPGLTLTSGSTYVAFLSVSDLGAQPESTFYMPFGAGGFGGNSLPGGEFVFYNNGTSFGALTTSGWDCPDGCGFGDAWFKAELSSPVPEPTTLVLLGLGLTGLRIRRWKKA